MRSGKKPTFYWDAAPLIAWIKNEQRVDPAEMDGLAEVVGMVDQGRAVLMTSVLWRVEVLDARLNATQRKRLEDAFAGRAIEELSIDGKIVALAGEIRSFYQGSTKKNVIKNITVPDALHLATAIHYNADEFHTFDGARPSSKNTGGLLTLNGNVAGHRLAILVPQADQLRLNFGQSDSDDA